MALPSWYYRYQSVRLNFRQAYSEALPLHSHLLQQIQELLDHSEKLSQTGSVLLAGDFNANPDSPEIGMISKQAGFTDALVEVGLGMEPTWSARNPLTAGVLIEEDHRCDYVFYKALAGQHHLVRTCVPMIVEG